MHEHYNNNEFYPYNLYASSKRSLETLLEYFKKKYPNILFYNLKFYESYSDNDQRDKIIPAIKKIITEIRELFYLFQILN